MSVTITILSVIHDVALFDHFYISLFLMLRFRCRLHFPKLNDLDSLPIAQDLKTSLRSMGVSRLTPVQSQSFSPITSGQSCVAIARTGEGKTLAYLIPLLTRLTDERLLNGQRSTSCVIAVPTRELCQQVASVLVGLSPSTNILLAYGKPDKAFKTLLNQNPPIVIGTGGRLASLVKKGDIDPRKLKIVVIDEVDSLLIKDYIRELSPLLNALNQESTQLIAVGATMSGELEQTLKVIPTLENAVRVNTTIQTKKTPESITHESVKVPDSQPLRISALAAILATQKFKQAIVFASSTAEIKAICQHPTLVSRAKSLHGDLPQAERERILNLFRAGTFDILVCTDVGSRGLDISGLDFVISFRPPVDPIGYIHRSGRTGRGNQKGKSITMYSSSERGLVDNIEKECVLKFSRVTCPSAEDQKRLFVDLIIEEASRRFAPTDSVTRFADNLSVSDKSKLITLCLNGLLGENIGLNPAPPKRSVLSGAEDMTPVLFLDPAKNTIKSRADVENIIESFDIKTYGMVALSESGYVVDIDTKAAVRLCVHRSEDVRQSVGVDIMLVEKLPKITSDGETRGRKFTGVLPWRKKTKSKK